MYLMGQFKFETYLKLHDWFSSYVYVKQGVGKIRVVIYILGFLV